MPEDMKDLQSRLWESAEELRDNSDLTSTQYSEPVFGLIFLKYADDIFTKVEKDLEEEFQNSRRTIGPDDYKAKGAMYLQKESRYSYLVNLPEEDSIGTAINNAMDLIEQQNEDLRGVLPKSYNTMGNSLLVDLMRIFNGIPSDLEIDYFGRIYEYFLGKFAKSEGEGGGEYYTPESIVKLIVNIIEPYNGKILDPACGSGGMFVQSAKFVQQHRDRVSDVVSIFGQESKTQTLKLAKMNMAVHGFSADIKKANTYYEDAHNSIGKFDFCIANPPFNNKKWKRDDLKDDPRYSIGIPNGENGNFLWIQSFYHSLNKKGRAGFVMANSAGDAGYSELEIRKRIIQTGHVDVLISISTNFFYTKTLPVTLWFFDKGKPADRKNKVLFIDATDIYNQVDRAHRDFKPEQLEFIANIVRLYRSNKVENTMGSQDLMDKHFSGGYIDVKGLCKVADISEIEGQGWSLNPGRYVGVADEKDDGLDYHDRLSELNNELNSLNTEAGEFESQISNNISVLLNE